MASLDAGQLLGLAGIAAALLLVAWLERRPATWHLGLAALLLLFGAIHLFLPGRTVALWATLAVITIVGVTSKLKYRYLGFNLLAGDIYHLAGTTVRGLVADHRRLIFPGLSAMITVLASAALIATAVEEPAIPLQTRLGLFGVTVLLYFIAFWASGGPARFRFQLLTQDRAHLSAFAASWFGAGPARRTAFVDIDPEPLPLLPSMPARRSPGEALPHIILILHESTFDPRQFGVPVGDAFERFLSPPGALSGALHVEVFGGGTVQTEFSVLTGLSSLSFGNDSRFVFHLLPGRIHHSLPSFLTGIGYANSLVSCSAPKVLNCDHFYRSVGLGRISYAEILPPPFDAERWQREQHDQQLFDHALDLFSHRENTAAPCFLGIMTMMNHGDHHRRVFPPDRHAELRQETIAATGSAAYGEYAVRLAESVGAYDAFRKGLDKALAGEPAIIVRFGDHQPFLTAPLSGLPSSDPALHKTFYAIEAVNCSIPPDLEAPQVLDVAYLSTLALLAAGVPLDPVFATRAALLQEDPAAYFDITSTTKRRFHRALVEAGLVDLP